MQPHGRSARPLPFQALLTDGLSDTTNEWLPWVGHSRHEAHRAAFNLKALSLEDLRQFQKDLAKAMSTYEDRHKASARAKLDEIAEDVDFSLADLIGTEVKPTRAPPAPKYRHLENPGLPWSGCGSNPLWLVAAPYAGKLPEDLMDAMTSGRNQTLSFFLSRKDRL